MTRQFRTLHAVAALALTVAVPGTAFAGMTEDVKAVNDGWAHIAYEVRGSSTQTQALDKLAKQASIVVARYPGRPEPLPPAHHRGRASRNSGGRPRRSAAR